MPQNHVTIFLEIQHPSLYFNHKFLTEIIKGTTEWTRDNVVLDVPEESELIAFGILLAGSGTARIADVTLEPVGLDVPTTDTQPKMSLPDEPVNLDFSDGAST